MSPNGAFKELERPIADLVRLVDTAPMEASARAGLMIMVASAFFAHAALSMREAGKSKGPDDEEQVFRSTMEMVIAGLEAAAGRTQ